MTGIPAASAGASIVLYPLIAVEQMMRSGSRAMIVSVSHFFPEDEVATVVTPSSAVMSLPMYSS